MSNKENFRKRLVEERHRTMDAVLYGKVPPQNTDLECAVLGAFMIDRDALEYLSMLSADDFYDDKNVMIFNAIQALYQSDRGVDVMTITEELRRMGNLEKAGGPFAIVTITNYVAASAHVEHHIKVLKQKSFRRNLIVNGSKLVSMAYDDNVEPDELMAVMEGLNSNEQIYDNQQIMHISEVAEAIIKEDQERALKNKSDGIIWGFHELDDDIGKMQFGDLVILAARSSMGKTSLMLKMALNQARYGIRVGILSMEMTKRSLYYRLLGLISGISPKRIEQVKLSEAERIVVQDARRELAALPIFIEDTANPTISQVKSRIKRMIRKHNVEIMYFDHLGKISNPNEENTYNMVTNIIRTLKASAKNNDIPFVVLTQLSRKTEQRANMRPALSDLRDSGAIEEEADIVGLCYRPEYYHVQGLSGFDKVWVRRRQISSAGYAEVIFAKNRNGAVQTVPFNFHGESMDWRTFRMEDFESADPSPKQEDRKKSGKEKSAGLFDDYVGLESSEPNFGLEEEPPF